MLLDILWSKPCTTYMSMWVSRERAEVLPGINQRPAYDARGPLFLDITMLKRWGWICRHENIGMFFDGTTFLASLAGSWAADTPPPIANIMLVRWVSGFKMMVDMGGVGKGASPPPPPPFCKHNAGRMDLEMIGMGFEGCSLMARHSLQASLHG